MKVSKFLQSGEVFYKPMMGESIESIAEKFGIGAGEILELNKQIQVATYGDVLYFKMGDLSTNVDGAALSSNFSEVNQSNFYVVQPLDSYEKIAERLGVDESALRGLNGNEVLFIGKLIKIKQV
jgi:LysM repeat protein